MRNAVLLVAVLLALTVFEARPHAEPESRRDGRITVIVGESGESVPSPRLIVMDADGKNRRGLLGYVVHASLSRDGRNIAYNALAARDARAIAADGRQDRLLARNAEGVDWSPNGHAIAFGRYHQGVCCGDSDIWIEDLDTRKQRRVVRNAEMPDWSGDGKKLAFVRWRTSDRTSSSAGDVWSVDLASGRARRLIRSGVDPRWSPKGDRIAFERFNRVGEDFIYLARADGTAERRIAKGEAAAWSPDGSELAIATFYRIIRIRPDGTHRRVVYAPKGGCPACRDVDWSR